MYPVLTKSGYRNFLLQCGKRVTSCSPSSSSPILRYVNDDSKSKNGENIKLPPEPTTCCMSGCANCVWIEYAETIAKLMDGNTEKVRELVLQRIEDPNLRMFLSVELKSIQYKSDMENKSSKDASSPKINDGGGEPGN